MSKTFSVADVAAHKDAENGVYIIIDENVYDITGTSSLPPFSLSALVALAVHPPTSSAARTIQRKSGANAQQDS